MKNLLLLIMCFPILLFGQGWEKTYENGVGFSVQQTSDGGYVITGYTYNSNNESRDIYLIKTDSYGDTLWIRTYGDSFTDVGHSVQQTIDGGFVITGSTYKDNSGTNVDICLIKTDSNGDIEWTKNYGGDYFDIGQSVQQTSDGGYIITGYSGSYGPTTDIILIKTDSQGDTAWVKSYDLGWDDKGYSVQQTSDHGYILTGKCYPLNYFSYDIFLIKTDSLGDTLWIKTFGNQYDHIGYAVQQTSDGGYIVTGTQVINTSFSDIILLKTDENGVTTWTKTYGDDFYYEIGHSVQQTLDNGYIIIGFTNSDNFSNHFSIYLMKTDSNGDTLWTKTYGGNYSIYGYSGQQTTDGGYIITGRKNNGNEDYIILIKTNESGIITSTTEIPIPYPSRKLVQKVDLLGREILNPPKNKPYIEIYDDGTTQKKMIK